MYEITEKSKFQDGIVLLYMAKNENYRCIYIEIKIMAEWHQSIYYIQCVWTDEVIEAIQYTMAFFLHWHWNTESFECIVSLF